MYTGNTNVELKVEKTMVEKPPEPVETTANVVDTTMATMKELLMALDDTNKILFGQPAFMPESAMPEPSCYAESIRVIREQANLALTRFIDIRKRLV